MNTEQLDTQVGIERIYTPDQLNRLLKDLPPFYYKPSLEQIQALPNESQTIRRYGDYNYTMSLGLVVQLDKTTQSFPDISQQDLTSLINWFGTLTDLTCMLSYNQNWYRESLEHFIANYDKWSQPCYFNILAEFAFCIKNIKNPKLVIKLTEVFRNVLEYERTKSAVL